MLNFNLNMLLVCLLLSSPIFSGFLLGKNQKLFKMNYEKGDKEVVPYEWNLKNFKFVKIDKAKKKDSKYNVYEVFYTFETAGIYFTGNYGNQGSDKVFEKDDHLFIAFGPKTISLGRGEITVLGDTIGYDEFITSMDEYYTKNPDTIPFDTQMKLKSYDEKMNPAYATRMIMSNTKVIFDLKTDYYSYDDFIRVPYKDATPFQNDDDKVPALIETLLPKYKQFVEFYLMREVRGIIIQNTWFGDENDGCLEILNPIFNQILEEETVVNSFTTMIADFAYDPQFASHPEFAQFETQTVYESPMNLILSCLMDIVRRESDDVLSFGTPANAIEDLDDVKESNKNIVFTHKTVWYKLLSRMYTLVFKAKELVTPNRLEFYGDIIEEPLNNSFKKFPDNKKFENTMKNGIKRVLNKFHNGLIIELIFYFETYKKEINEFITLYIAKTNKLFPIAQMFKLESHGYEQELDGAVLKTYMEYFDIDTGDYGEDSDDDGSVIDIFTWSETRKDSGQNRAVKNNSKTKTKAQLKNKRKTQDDSEESDDSNSSNDSNRRILI